MEIKEERERERESKTREFMSAGRMQLLLGGHILTLEKAASTGGKEMQTRYLTHL